MSKVSIGHNAGNRFVEDESLSLSEKGYQFQFHYTRQIIERLQGFTTVRLFNMNGDAITLSNYEQRGADGGLDLIIRIETKTELASLQIAGKVRKILMEL